MSTSTIPFKALVSSGCEIDKIVDFIPSSVEGLLCGE